MKPLDRTTVMVAEPPASLTEKALVEKFNSPGAKSFSTIVSMAVAIPAPPVIFVSVRVTVSFPSTSKSSEIGMFTVFSDSPEANVSTLLTAV